MSQKIKILCENEIVEVDLDIVMKSPILKTMIDDTGKEGEIPIPNTHMSTLKKVFEYCEHYRTSVPKEISRPLKNNNLAQHGVEEWDVNFIDMGSVDEIIDIVVAANFLGIEPLLVLGCAKIASLIKGKSTEEIREIFNIVNDFTPEEENQLREENKWAEEAI